MTTTDSAHSEVVQADKSRRLQPIIYTKLSTSTFMNHQRLKRIKGLLGYSEQFKETHKEYESPKSRIKPFKSRDYRMTREMDLEIYEVNSRIKRFLKVQRNLRIIRIRLLSLESRIRDNTKLLCEIFGSMSRINRIQIDFLPSHRLLGNQSILEKVKATRKLPNLKELSITRGNEEISKISIPLLKLGFGYHYNNGISVKDHLNIEKLIKKIPKFEKFDTIRLKNKLTGDSSEDILEALALVISKLPNLREFSMEFATHGCPTIAHTLKILDMLLKVPSLEILKFKNQNDQEELESLLTHPIFKATSLKRVHLSFCSYSLSSELLQAMKLFLDIPMIYELSLCLAYEELGEEATGGIMKEIAKMVNLRKLHLEFGYASGLSEKQAWDILCSVSRMSGLKELDLFIETKKTDLDENFEVLGLGDEIKDLPRLQKVKLAYKRIDSPSDKILVVMAEFFGKCSRLKEMEFNMEDCQITSWEGVSRKLLESWGRLDHLQLVKLNLKTKLGVDLMTVPVRMFADWMWVFDGMESLQDIFICKWAGSQTAYESECYENMKEEALRNPKYRFLQIDDLW